MAALSERQRLADAAMLRWEQANPHPRCELYYRTDFQLLLAVVLSAQATDRSVNAAMTAAYDQGLDAKKVLALGESGMLAMIRRIGLAPTKAKRAVALARLLVDRYAGQVPRTRAELEALPGVGRKTANVVLAELCQEPTLAVDTHVFRVTSRLRWQEAPTPLAAEPELMRVIDCRWLPRAHHWLVLHGRYVCKARKPDCETCVVADLCPSARRG